MDKFPSTYVGSLPQLIACYNEVEHYNTNNDYVGGMWYYINIIWIIYCERRLQIV